MAENQNGVKRMEIKHILSREALLTSYEKFPFEVKRIYCIKNLQVGDVRGNHTHKKTRQVVTCLQGSCYMTINKSAKMFIDMNESYLIEPKDIHKIYNFSKDCILMVLASEEFSEDDYIR